MVYGGNRSCHKNFHKTSINQPRCGSIDEILRITWTEQITIEEVLKRIETTKKLLLVIRKRHLKFMEPIIIIMY